MKTIIVAGVAMSVVIGGMTLIPSRSSTVNNTIEVEKEVTPDWAQDADAVKAAQDVIRRKELEAEEARLVAEITSRQEELDAIRKELGSY